MEKVSFRDYAKEVADKNPIIGNLTISFVRIGDDSASITYINNKTKFLSDRGIKCNDVVINGKILDSIKNMPYKERNIYISEYIKDKTKDSDGVLIQLPIQGVFNSEKIIDSISTNKDVDCLKTENLGVAYKSGLLLMQPCTTIGVALMAEKLLKDYNMGTDLKGKVVTVVGKSELVGKPTTMYFSTKGATVIECNSSTPRDLLVKFVNMSDIVVLATGCRGVLKSSDITKDNYTIIIDVGINNVDGKILGDFVVDSDISKIKGAYTSVPGGAGPMTILGLFLRCSLLSKHINGGSNGN